MCKNLFQDIRVKEQYNKIIYNIYYNYCFVINKENIDNEVSHIC